MAVALDSSKSIGTKLEGELFLPEDEIPMLDESMLQLTADQLDLLRLTLSMDDDQLKKHILEVQKEAYEEFPYVCIRLFSYINFYISMHPIYKEVLKAGNEENDTLFLDIPCCMGADSRKLVFDGYPSQNIYAADLHPRFLELGYKLFNDKDSCGINFFPADLFDFPVIGSGARQQESPLEKLRGRMTHIYAGLFFHLFDEPTQREVAKRFAALISRKPGSIIFGSQVGQDPAGPSFFPAARARYGHSPFTWASLWRDVFIDVEGVTFANERVQIDSKSADSGELFTGDNVKGFPTLIWSVKIT